MTAGRALVSKVIVAAVMAAGALSSTLVADSRELVRARDRYRQGDFLGAIKLLESARALDAEGLLLAGQAYYRAGNIRTAVRTGFRSRPTTGSIVHRKGPT